MHGNQRDGGAGRYYASFTARELAVRRRTQNEEDMRSLIARLPFVLALAFAGAAMRRIVLAAALAGLVLSNARADDASEPAVRAQLLLPLPGERVMAIEPRDDTDENLKLRDLMTARLVEQHGRVAADAPLVLRFSIGVISGRDTPREGPPGRSGLSGGGRAPPNAIPPDTPVTYRLSATLEQRNGPILWKADVTAQPSGQNERQLPARLAVVLIDNIGRSVDTGRPVGASANPAR